VRSPGPTYPFGRPRSCSRAACRRPRARCAASRRP
jgi:hypothetical protein